MSISKNTDWTKYATLATNSCYHIGKSNIFQAFKDSINTDLASVFTK